MADDDFSYNLGSNDAETVRVSKVRLELGDTKHGSGVMPDLTNLADEEIKVWLSNEGDDIYRAVAAACEALARIWSSVADTSTGPRSERLSAVSENWMKRAKELRDQHGGEAQVYNAFSAGVIRVDGFSDDEPSDAVEATGQEYEGSFEYIRPE